MDDETLILADMARELGLPISTEVPRAVYELMDLYPQGRSARPPRSEK